MCGEMLIRRLKTNWWCARKHLKCCLLMAFTHMWECILYLHFANGNSEIQRPKWCAQDLIVNIRAKSKSLRPDLHHKCTTSGSSVLKVTVKSRQFASKSRSSIVISGLYLSRLAGTAECLKSSRVTKRVELGTSPACQPWVGEVEWCKKHSSCLSPRCSNIQLYLYWHGHN